MKKVFLTALLGMIMATTATLTSCSSSDSNDDGGTKSKTNKNDSSSSEKGRKLPPPPAMGSNAVQQEEGFAPSSGTHRPAPASVQQEEGFAPSPETQRTAPASNMSSSLQYYKEQCDQAIPLLRALGKAFEKGDEDKCLQITRQLVILNQKSELAAANLTAAEKKQVDDAFAKKIENDHELQYCSMIFAQIIGAIGNNGSGGYYDDDDDYDFDYDDYDYDWDF